MRGHTKHESRIEFKKSSRQQDEEKVKKLRALAKANIDICDRISSLEKAIEQNTVLYEQTKLLQFYEPLKMYKSARALSATEKIKLIEQKNNADQNELQNLREAKLINDSEIIKEKINLGIKELNEKVFIKSSDKAGTSGYSSLAVSVFKKHNSRSSIEPQTKGIECKLGKG